MNRILGTIFHDALTDQGGPETPQGQVDGQPQDQLTTDPEQDNPVLDAGGNDLRARAAYLQQTVDKYNQAFNQHPDIKEQLFGDDQPNRLQQQRQKQPQREQAPSEDEGDQYVGEMTRSEIIALQKQATLDAMREAHETTERTEQLRDTVHASVAQVASELGYTNETVAPVLREVKKYKFDMNTEEGLRAYGYTLSLALAVYADADTMMQRSQEAAAKASDAARKASLAQPPGPGRPGPQAPKSKATQHLEQMRAAGPKDLRDLLGSRRR